MKYLKYPVVGIDVPIQQLQIEVHDGLLCAFQLDDSKVQACGRIYKNSNGTGGYLPYAYMGEGKSDYEPIVLDDRYALQFFFGVGDEHKVQTAYNLSSIHVIVMADLSQLSELPTRADAEVRDAIQVMLENAHGLTVNSIITSTPKVFAEYAISRNSGQAQDGAKAYDVHPNYCMRFECTLLWDKPQRSNDLPDTES